MQDLRLIGVHEDGLHLLLAGADGERFRVPLDDALRAAARRDRPRLGQLQIETDSGLRPREVQAMIRGGASADEVAERSGWSVEKVRKYEGPILAERAHVADLARKVRVRARGGSGGGSAPTLGGRVAQRMRERGVDGDSSTWDAWRSPEGGPWTVVLTFAAGGRQRQASWAFDLVSRTVDAVDDEARWLSEDEPTVTGPILAGPVASPRPTTVYDVEAEGGVTSAAPAARAQNEPVDLMTAMRERSAVRGRRSGGRRKAPSPAELPGEGRALEDALPLEDLRYDRATDGLPPPAHGHPDDDPEVIRAVDAVVPVSGGAQATGDPGPALEPDAPTEPDASTEPESTDPESTKRVGTPPEQPAARAGATRGSAAADKVQAGTKDAAGRKSGRASVPSWDDIMFGARRD
jgi:hypothetical protein